MNTNESLERAVRSGAHDYDDASQVAFLWAVYEEQDLTEELVALAERIWTEARRETQGR